MLGFLVALFALMPPPGAVVTAAPSPAAPAALRTIVTVKSSPYCDALKNHFNDVFVPMIANDRAFAVLGDQLGSMNELFTKPTYATDFVVLRGRMMHQLSGIEQSLPTMQHEIDALRLAQSTTTDQAAASDMKATASKLQSAYDKQRQMATDLHGVVQSMMEYDPLEGNHAPGGMDPSTIGMPQDTRDVRSYLRYDTRRAALADAENTAVDEASDVAEKRCTE